MRKKITALAAAGILLFAACSGDDDDTTTDAASEDGGGSESNATGDGGGGNGGGGGGFCEEATQLFQTTSGLDPDEQLAQVREIEPPAEIAEDWNKLIETSLESAEAGTVNPDDPDAAAEFQEQYEDLAEATTNVYTYLGEECGLEGFTPPPSDGQVTVPTTAGG